MKPERREAAALFLAEYLKLVRRHGFFVAHCHHCEAWIQDMAGEYAGKDLREQRKELKESLGREE